MSRPEVCGYCGDGDPVGRQGNRPACARCCAAFAEGGLRLSVPRAPAKCEGAPVEGALRRVVA